MKYKCTRCKKEIEGLKNIKKVNKERLCKKCYQKNKKDHRKETIKEAGIENELKELDRIIKNESQRKTYRIKNPKKSNTYIPKRYQVKSENNVVQESDSPIKIKGSNISKPKPKTESYITMQEQQIILRQLMSRGYSFDEAKERISELKTQLKDTRDKLKDKKDSEENYKVSKNNLLEGLWN